MARKDTARRQAKDKGKNRLYLDLMDATPKSDTLEKLPIKVECIIRFASDERISLISKDGNNIMSVAFGDNEGERLSRKKLQKLISHFNLENSKQLKGRIVDVLASDDGSAVIDIFAK